MRIECFKIDGNIYAPLHIDSKKITIGFYLCIEHIHAMRIKSNYFPMKISRDIFYKATNAGMKRTKCITITNHPCFIQQFFDRVGFDFSERNINGNERILYMPYLLGTLKN